MKFKKKGSKVSKEGCRHEEKVKKNLQYAAELEVNASDSIEPNYLKHQELLSLFFREVPLKDLKSKKRGKRKIKAKDED